MDEKNIFACLGDLYFKAHSQETLLAHYQKLIEELREQVRQLQVENEKLKNATK